MSHLDTRILALHPERLDGISAWVTHVPFAFWIVDAIRPDRLVELGTHSGVSYCAFCQAIKVLDLKTVAHAIDTWEGDFQSGDYPGDVYHDLRSHHDSRYSAFSDLVRSTFDDAAEKFADGSIDLLHIDGLHTAEAVKHDFETWRPKLSDRAVVLFHDTNVYERDFGVQAFWRELADDFPSFEFIHGHGLGVLAIGKHQPPAIRWLTALSKKKALKVRNFFASAAEHLGDQTNSIGELAKLRLDLAHTQHERDVAMAAIESTREHSLQVMTANDELQASRGSLETEIIRLKSQLNILSASKASAMEQQLADHNHRKVQVDWLGTDNQRLWAECEALKSSNQQLRKDRAMLRNKAGKFEDDIGQMLGSSSWRLTSPVRSVGTMAKGLQAPHSLPRVVARTLRSPGGLGRGLAALRSRGLKGSIQRVNNQIDAALVRSEIDQQVIPAQALAYRRWIVEHDSLTDDDRVAARSFLEKLSYRPLISIVVPVYNTRPDFLASCIDSVIEQLYPNWQLCIADDSSSDAGVLELLTAYAEDDPRIKVCARPAQGGIAAASNSALEFADGEFVALLDHDDVLPEHALTTIIATLNAHPGADILYSDEDKIDELGARYEPHFKTDYNYELLLGQNFIGHLGVYRKSLLDSINGFREGFDGSQDHDLALRAVAATTPDNIVHLPYVLYHWRVFNESGSYSTDQLPASMHSAQKAISEHLQQQPGGADARVVAAGFGCFHQVVWPSPLPEPSVGVIVPTRDNPECLEKCVSGLLNNTYYSNLQIVLVDNGSVELRTLGLLEELKKHNRVRVLRDERPFNYSQLNNFAAEVLDTDYLCLLNDDIQVIEPDWLGQMVALASREGIGAVGARLLFPDDTVQHGGVVLGIMGVASHFGRHLQVDEPGYFGRLQLCQEVSAVTAACMVVRKSIYTEAGGLNAEELSVAFNDIDFCLRLRELGYRNLWTPAATLYHLESASRGLDEEHWTKRNRFEREVAFIQERWGEDLLCDSFYNPNLTLDENDMSLANPPRVVLPWRVRSAERGVLEEQGQSEPEELPATSAHNGIAPRSAYKATWNTLAETDEQARISVGGFSDEASFIDTGEATLSILQRTVGISESDDVLEIGCGVARIGFVLAPHCASWTGCDVSANMLKHARSRVGAIENVQLVEISGFDLAPIADASMDVVYCAVVFMHLDEWDRFNYLREAWRVLRPGGRVYVDNFTIETEEGWAVFEECLAYDPLARPSHTSKSSTTQEITILLSQAGFGAITTDLEGAWVRGWGEKK